MTPAVGSPFAMTQWCAATHLNGISRTMYRRCDSVLIGFMGTHQPAIWMGGYGFMTLMPQSGELKIKATDRQVRLDRGKEVATPYYYMVSYASGKHGGSEITTEMTATSRTFFFHITYPKGKNPCFSKIDLEGASEEDRKIFYTAFSRTLQYPREFSEYGRYYSPFDDKVHQGVPYNAYSLWDTFRAEHPWL